MVAGDDWCKSFGILVEGTRGGVATGSIRKFEIGFIGNTYGK
jgi:hypothetical protein